MDRGDDRIEHGAEPPPAAHREPDQETGHPAHQKPAAIRISVAERCSQSWPATRDSCRARPMARGAGNRSPE